MAASAGRWLRAAASELSLHCSGNPEGDTHQSVREGGRGGEGESTWRERVFTRSTALPQVIASCK